MLTLTMPTTLPKLKPEAFEALLAKSRLKEQAAAIARAVLVDGKGYAEAAQEVEKPRQFAYQSVKRLLEADSDEMYTYEGSPEMFAEIDAIVDRHKGRRMLTKKQFNATAKLTEQEEHSIELARSVLVDGVENIELAKKYDIARHLPWQAAQRFMRYFDTSVATTRVYKGTTAMFEEIDAFLKKAKG
ncbi:MAG: hypothetical protein I4O49_19550 [Janthinobacterium lividum]|nr:hypothetical protein [Janthinobacterium lividum]